VTGGTSIRRWEGESLEISLFGGEERGKRGELSKKKGELGERTLLIPHSLFVSGVGVGGTENVTESPSLSHFPFPAEKGSLTSPFPSLSSSSQVWGGV